MAVESRRKSAATATAPEFPGARAAERERERLVAELELEVTVALAIGEVSRDVARWWRDCTTPMHDVIARRHNSDGRAHGALTAAVASRNHPHEVTTARDHDTALPSPRRRHTPTHLSHHTPHSLESALRRSAEASSFRRCMVVAPFFRLGGCRLRAPLARNCPQASAPCPVHTRHIPLHRGGSDGRRLVLWIGGHLAHSRLVFVFLRCI